MLCGQSQAADQYSQLPDRTSIKYLFSCTLLVSQMF
jgi:hypothetical protein